MYEGSQLIGLPGPGSWKGKEMLIPQEKNKTTTTIFESNMKQAFVKYWPGSWIPTSLHPKLPEYGAELH